MPVLTLPSVATLPWVNAATPPLARRLFRYYGPAEVGRSILLIGGVYTLVDTPDQLTLATATEIYLGGHVYSVTQAVADALTAAGFGAYVTADPVDPSHTWAHYADNFWGELAGYRWSEL